MRGFQHQKHSPQRDTEENQNPTRLQKSLSQQRTLRSAEEIRILSLYKNRDKLGSLDGQKEYRGPSACKKLRPQDDKGWEVFREL